MSFQCRAFINNQVLRPGVGKQANGVAIMSNDFTFSIKRQAFDEHYQPADSTRLTTNFANLARGESRRQNLRKALKMIDSRFNALAHWDNPTGDRYAVELEIVSVDINIANTRNAFPSIEILKTSILDQHTQERFDGVVGNNFSSYVRDYDFSVLLIEHNKNKRRLTVTQFKRMQKQWQVGLIGLVLLGAGIHVQVPTNVTPCPRLQYTLIISVRTARNPGGAAPLP